MVEIFLDRSGNEILAAGSLRRLSVDEKAKQEFSIPRETTFYSSVISHSYYSIFYAAKEILLTKGVRTTSPEIHKKTFDAFKKHFVDSGVLDVKLLEIYKKIAIRADELLEIFREEKRKRGNYTYNTLPQANEDPAAESLENAKTFISNIAKVIQMT